MTLADLRYRTLVQGDCLICLDPQEALRTVLGSCVAVCLWDRALRIGGMIHFSLPQAPDPDAPDAQQGRYGQTALPMLIARLGEQGAVPARLEARIFGGANVARGLRDIGADNIAFARDALRQRGISCRTASIGGACARRVDFHPASGRARSVLIAPPQ